MTKALSKSSGSNWQVVLQINPTLSSFSSGP